MKYFKKIPLFILVFFVGFASGITLYKLNIPPIPQFRFLGYFFFAPDELKKLVAGEINIIVTRYTKGTPLFSDRPYFDTLGPKELEGLTLIQIPRHTRHRIRLDAKKPLTVYRIISASNDNWLLDGYQKTDLKVNVVGKSIHREVVKKSFPPGIIDLFAGGPSVSSPILISPPDSGFLPTAIFIN